MEIIEILKQFKNIEADKDFIKKSRSLILDSRKTPKFGFWEVFTRTTEFGAAVSLAGLLIFMILGGFSAWRSFSPLPIANLDPASLKAEAQAIDIQIQLTDLNYNGGGLLIKSSESTAGSPVLPSAAKPNKENGVLGGAAGDNTSTPSSVSVDEALQKLSE